MRIDKYFTFNYMKTKIKIKHSIRVKGKNIWRYCEGKSTRWLKGMFLFFFSILSFVLTYWIVDTFLLIFLRLFIKFACKSLIREIKKRWNNKNNEVRGKFKIESPKANRKIKSSNKSNKWKSSKGDIQHFIQII